MLESTSYISVCWQESLRSNGALTKMRLEGKVALITGAAKGIGAAEAGLFAEQGAIVVVSDVREDIGLSIAAHISAKGGRSSFVKLDVANPEDWKDAVDQIVLRFGKLDVLVNNASIYSMVPVEITNLDEWDELMGVNARGTFLGTINAIPAMRDCGGGSIVNISSTAAIIGSLKGGAYGASKAAVRLLTKATAVQHAKDGIRANSIHPGPIETEMIASLIGTPDGRAASISRIPIGRLGTIWDVAHAALFLASDESSFMTGSELLIDGGMTAQ